MIEGDSPTLLLSYGQACGFHILLSRHLQPGSLAHWAWEIGCASLLSCFNSSKSAGHANERLGCARLPDGRSIEIAMVDTSAQQQIIEISGYARNFEDHGVALLCLATPVAIVEACAACCSDPNFVPWGGNVRPDTNTDSLVQRHHGFDFQHLLSHDLDLDRSDATLQYLETVTFDDIWQCHAGNGSARRDECERMAMDAIAFAWLHEIGHVFLCHKRDDRIFGMSERWALPQRRYSMPEARDLYIHQLKELAADQFAARTLFNAAYQQKQGLAPLAQSSTDSIVLRLAGCLIPIAIFHAQTALSQIDARRASGDCGQKMGGRGSFLRRIARQLEGMLSSESDKRRGRLLGAEYPPLWVRAHCILASERASYRKFAKTLRDVDTQEMTMARLEGILRALARLEPFLADLVGPALGEERSHFAARYTLDLRAELGRAGVAS